jgi:hypothetical protein
MIVAILNTIWKEAMDITYTTVLDASVKDAILLRI